MVPTSRGGGEGGGSYCDHRLWDPPHPSSLLLVTWGSHIGVGRRLYEGRAQPTEVTAELGETVQGVWKGRRGFPDLGNNLRSGGPGGPDLWVRDLGDDTVGRVLGGFHHRVERRLTGWQPRMGR